MGKHKKTQNQSPFSFAEVMNFEEITDFEFDTFKNDEDLDIAYYKFSPANPKSRLIFVHGGGAYSKLGYLPMAKALKEQFDMETILIDIVGHGKSEGRRGDCSSPESVYRDIRKLAEIVSDGKVPTYLGGHSSGGGVVLNYADWATDKFFAGYIFVSPEFGYKSNTEKKGRVEFGNIEVWKFILNSMSFGLLFPHSYAVKFNYPAEILKSDDLIVKSLTVNMANASTPKNPQKQISNIDAPIAIFVGENDELFDPLKVIKYKNFHGNSKSVAEIVENANHLSILLKISQKVGSTVSDWLGDNSYSYLSASNAEIRVARKAG